MKARLCLIEDDPTIRELVAERLAREYEVDGFEAAESVIESGKRWDLYIVDVMLKGALTGFDLCRTLKEQSPSVPILILSALSESSNRIEGLRTGADDYLTKPFEMEELLLRVAGMLKRRSWYALMPAAGSIYRWSNKSINFVNYEGKKGTLTFSLSQKECMLMKLLIEKEGQVVPRDEILDQVWGYDAFPSTRTVDNFILRLRKYFEDTPQEPKHIHSVRGVGYRFTK
ncbi:MAG: response regulator transcription factor [Deltaproteobacteria bacterium]|nr:response regulator transcription factor [Deltaproteobacteria bacterium]